MITVHTIDEMKTMIYSDARRRKNVLESVISDEKLSFSASIVEYNRFMSESNENAQQRSYYSSHRLDRRYWWSFFVFLLNAVVLNAYKLWDRLYLESKLSHSEFQQQIVETLLQNETITRKRSSALMINALVFDAVNKSDSCEWEFTHKRSYCQLCRKKNVRLRERQALKKISVNLIKKRRTSQIRWRCKSCGLCCKKKECWWALHSHSNA